MQKLLDESGLMRGLLANVDKGPFTLFVPTDRAFNQFLLTVMGGVSKGLARLDTNKSELYQVHTLPTQLCFYQVKKWFHFIINNLSWKGLSMYIFWINCSNFFAGLKEASIADFF